MFLPDAVTYNTLTCMGEKSGLSAIIKQAHVTSGIFVDAAQPKGDTE
jgi:hypothetical protein